MPIPEKRPPQNEREMNIALDAIEQMFKPASDTVDPTAPDPPDRLARIEVKLDKLLSIFGNHYLIDGQFRELEHIKPPTP